MTIKTARPTITTTRAELTGTDTDYNSGSSVDVFVVSGSTLYVGGADVTAANGRPVAVGESYALDVRAGDRLYGITASGTATVAVLRTGV